MLEPQLLEHNANCLLISHDRAFGRAVATRVWMISDRRLVEIDDPEPVFDLLMAVDAPRFLVERYGLGPYKDPMVDQPFPVEICARSTSAAVLVSGASFAGLATAYWMNRLGYRVTVIEVARGLRKGGTPVDIEGETIGILARMGMIGAVRAKALPPRGLEFKDADDNTVGVLGGHSALDDAQNDKYEIHRDDLLEILFASIEGSAEVVFGRSTEQLDDGPDEVAVTFNDGSRRGYTLVLGCDGNRVNTKQKSAG